MPRCRLPVIVAAVLLLPLVALPAAAQRGRAYCNLTEIKAEQLTNGVRVTITADGELQWRDGFQELIETGAIEVTYHGPHGFSAMPTEKFDRMPFILLNARSALGSAFIPIGKYPVSHAEISIPPWTSGTEGVGLRVDIVNYLGWVSGEGRRQQFRYNLNLMPGEDRRSIILIWGADRFPPPPSPKTPADLPSELTIVGGPERISVRALNARLQEVTNAIAARTGLRIDAPPDSDLRVTCHLSATPPDQVIEAIAIAVGLCDLRLPDGSWLLAADLEAAGGYSAACTRRVPLAHLRANDALDLLPNFLLKHLQADPEGNSVVVSGPRWMTERVAQDLAKLDVPPREVFVEVALVEYTSGTAFSRALRLERLANNASVLFDTLSGDLRFLWLPEIERGWQGVLGDLRVESTGRLCATATLRVVNGHVGRIFSGQNRTLVVDQVDPEGALVPSLEQVAIGTSMWVQPQVGTGDEVVLHLNLESNSLRATDPTTGLPEIGRRTVNSALRVRDGETVLLAGLRLEDQTGETRVIPILGTLPLVGSLFHTPVRSRSRAELAIFVTPHIVAEGGRLSARSREKTEVADQGESHRG